MTAKFLNMVAGMALFFCAGMAQANTVDVSYTVSGSAGAWLLNFSVTNNIGTDDIYYFGIHLPDGDYVGAPSSWGPPGSFSLPQYGTSAVNYNVAWLDPSGVAAPTNIMPGQTLGGFRVLDPNSTLPSSVSWTVLSGGGFYTGSDCIGCSPTAGSNGLSAFVYSGTSKPRFGGTAFAAVTPLPAALPLFATGLGALALFGWRRKRKAAAHVG
jgi:hypothetical protein